VNATFARTFASVRKHRNYRLYFGGQSVSFVGSWMQQIAASWLVLQLTHSAVAVGALALTQLLPVTVLGLFVGTLFDRFEVRRVALWTEWASLATAGALAALTLAHVVTVWEIFLFAGLLGVAQAVGGPARHALVFEMVGPEDLANAVSLNSSIGTAARVLGPAIGGGVVAFAGAGVAFGINSLSFLGELVALLALDTSKLHRPVRDQGATVLGGAYDALRFVMTTPRAAVAFFGVLALSTFSFNFNVLLPLVAERTLSAGAQTFGLIAAVFGAGALVGATVNATRGRASLRVLLIGALGYGVFELALAPQRSLVAVCVMLFAIGFFYTQWGTTALATIQLEAPERLRGRAASLYFFAFLGGAPLGGLFAGWLVDVGGTSLAFFVAGSIAVVTSLACAGTLLTTAPRGAWRRRPSAAESVSG
jgi:MFS family permease